MNNIEQCQEKLMRSDMRTYRASPTLLFALSDTRVLVMTNFHTFYLRLNHINYRARLSRIRLLIENDKIQTVTDLICELNADNKSGVEMVHTDLNYYVKEEQTA